MRRCGLEGRQHLTRARSPLPFRRAFEILGELPGCQHGKRQTP